MILLNIFKSKPSTRNYLLFPDSFFKIQILFLLGFISFFSLNHSVNGERLILMVELPPRTSSSNDSTSSAHILKSDPKILSTSESAKALTALRNARTIKLIRENDTTMAEIIAATTIEHESDPVLFSSTTPSSLTSFSTAATVLEPKTSTTHKPNIRSDPFSRRKSNNNGSSSKKTTAKSSITRPSMVLESRSSNIEEITNTTINSNNFNKSTAKLTSDLVIKKKILKASPMLKQIHDYLIVLLLVSVMFAMGCSITWEQVWGHVRRPVGVIIGMISQFVLLPACAYFLIVVFNIDPLHATGLLILACSPGGVTSNVFTYFCEGDLSLSVTMTSFSTIVALVMMPFNVWIYGRKLETGALIIPYTKMTISLLTLTTPVVMGMFVNWKCPKFAPILTNIGSVAGFAIIIVCQTLEVFIFPDIFNDVPMVLYAAEFLLPLLGLAMGFGTASILRLPYPIRRTIAIEAGVQNVGTALTIITLSFPFEQLKKVWLFPFLYAFSMLAVCCIVAVIYRLQKRFKHRVKSLDIMDHPNVKKTLKQHLEQQPQI